MDGEFRLSFLNWESSYRMTDKGSGYVSKAEKPHGMDNPKIYILND